MDSLTREMRAMEHTHSSATNEAPVEEPPNNTLVGLSMESNEAADALHGAVAAVEPSHPIHALADTASPPSNAVLRATEATHADTTRPHDAVTGRSRVQLVSVWTGTLPTIDSEGHTVAPESLRLPDGTVIDAKNTLQSHSFVARMAAAATTALEPWLAGSVWTSRDEANAVDSDHSTDSFTFFNPMAMDSNSSRGGLDKVSHTGMSEFDAPDVTTNSKEKRVQPRPTPVQGPTHPSLPSTIHALLMPQTHNLHSTTQQPLEPMVGVTLFDAQGDIVVPLPMQLVEGVPATAAPNKPWWVQRRRLWMGSLFVLVVMAAVASGICLPGGRCVPRGSVSSSGPTSELPNMTVTTVTPLTREAQVVDFINSITLSGQTMTRPGLTLGNVTVEQQALNWLIDVDPKNWTPNSPVSQFYLQQRYALVILYLHQDEPNLRATECGWTGISCQTVTLNGMDIVDAVRGIYWYQFSWFGHMVPDLGLLSHLEKFDVTINFLTGSLPESIGLWTNLYYFDVYGNQLTGSLPESIANWTNLERFNVGGNQLTGSLPDSIGLWTNLEWFDVEWNDLTGTLPESIANWTNLVYFDVWDNQLNGTLPDSIGNWTNLKDFDVQYNDLTGSLPDSIGNWTNLEYFNVQYNQLTGSLPESIGNWTSLEYAYFQDNNFIGSVPIGLCSAVNLTNIWVDCGELECSCSECNTCR